MEGVTPCLLDHPSGHFRYSYGVASLENLARTTWLLDKIAAYQKGDLIEIPAFRDNQTWILKKHPYWKMKKQQGEKWWIITCEYMAGHYLVNEEVDIPQFTLTTLTPVKLRMIERILWLFDE